MSPLSYKTRLRVFLVLFALLPLLIVGVSSYTAIVEERKIQRAMDTENYLISQSKIIENYILSLESELTSIVKTASYFESFASQSKAEYLDHVRTVQINGEKPYVFTVNVLSGKETELVNDEVLLPTIVGENIQQEYSVFWEVMDNNSNRVNAYVVNWLQHKGVYVVAGVSLPLDEVESIITLNESINIYGVSIIENNKMIFNSIEDDLYNEIDWSSGLKFIKQISGEKGRVYLLDATPDHTLKIAIVGEINKSDKLITGIKLKYLTTSIMLCVLAFVMAVAYADHMYLPIKTITRKANEMIEGNLSTRVNLTHTGIFKFVVDGFNTVARTTESNYEQLMSQSMEMIRKQDELIHVNQSLEYNYEVLTTTNRKLEYSKEKFKMLIKNISDLVWVLDENDRLVFVNEAFEERLGYKSGELIGEPFDRILDQDSNLYSAESVLDRIKDSNVEDYQIQFSNQSQTDSEIMITNTIKIYRDDVYKGIQGISRPVSESWLQTQKLTRRSQALDDIRSITRTLATENNLDALFSLIVQKINELYDVVICSVRIMNSKNELELVNATGPGSLTISGEPIRDRSDIRFRVLEENRMSYLEQIDQNLLENYEELMNMSEDIESLVILPLADMVSKTGVIAVAFSKPLPQNELMILSTIGIQSTLAIKKAQLYEKQREEFLATIRVLVTAIEAKDAYTEGHSNRVSEIATAIGSELGLSSQGVEDIQFAGILHDIGKIGIDDFILTKKGRLSPFESDKIKEHPEIGERILQPIGFSEQIMDGVTLHHKRYDLTGYPEKVEIEKLPLSAAIIGVADALDAMTSSRSYSTGRPLHEAIVEIEKNKTSQFDPVVVDSILRIYHNEPHVLEKIINGKAEVMN